MKKIIKIVLGIVVVLAVVFLISRNSASGEKIKIGALMPQTGFGAYWGGPGVKGIELAKKDLETMYGKGNVKIVIEDSQSDNAKAVSGAQKLLSVDKVDGLYTEFSGIGSAVSPIAKSADKTLVYSTYNQKIADDNQLSLKTFLSFNEACSKFAKYVNDSNKKFLIISAVGDTAPYCADGLATVVGRENIKVVQGLSPKDTDFRTLLLQNKSFAPDYIIPIMYEDGSYALLKQANDMGIKAGFFSDKQDLATDKNIANLPAEATNNVVYFEARINQKFVDKIKAVYPELSNDDLQAAANSYQSIMALGIGLVECGNKSAECVTGKLANKSDLPLVGYENAKFVNRILESDLVFGKLVNKEKVEIK
ncbi:MAG: ABC transporter substrate-binding protein [bacterium]